MLAGEIDQQAGDLLDAHAGNVLYRFAEQLDPLLRREHRGLAARHGDDHRTEDLVRPAQDIHVPVGYGVESPGVDRDRQLTLLTSRAPPRPGQAGRLRALVKPGASAPVSDPAGAVATGAVQIVEAHGRIAMAPRDLARQPRAEVRGHGTAAVLVDDSAGRVDL